MKGRLLSIAVAVGLLFASAGSIASAEGPDTGAAGVPYHPVNPGYTATKAAIDARGPKKPGGGGSSGSGGSTSSSISPSWQGEGANGLSPSDATGAMGPTEYVELVNEEIGVYSRSGSLQSSNSEAGFTGFSSASGDGQIVWDPSTNRFYIAMLNNLGSNSYDLLWGFSKGSAPTASASDWCSYHSAFGVYGANQLPDYPKLGTTQDLLLIGVNHFAYSAGNWNYGGSDVAWVTKPAVGTSTIATCPDPTTFTSNVQSNLKNSNGTDASTPVPGRQTDASTTGYIVANEDPEDSGTGQSNVLSVIPVVEGSNFTPSFGPAETVTVPAYAYPPSAPQYGTSYTLDTMDTRLTNAWLAPDPSQGGKVALWTQHTVAASSGGFGAEVRWYEIDPTTGSLFQSGKVQSANLYVFDGAIAPDRQGQVGSTAGQFGSAMVLGFNTSSSQTYPALQSVSKVGSNSQSGFVMVHQSSKSDTEFTCSKTTPCRWGDYAGASPDPNPGTTGTGRVWLSGMLSNGGLFVTATWITWNWRAAP